MKYVLLLIILLLLIYGKKFIFETYNITECEDSKKINNMKKKNIEDMNKFLSDMDKIIQTNFYTYDLECNKRKHKYITLSGKEIKEINDNFIIKKLDVQDKSQEKIYYLLNNYRIIPYLGYKIKKIIERFPFLTNTYEMKNGKVVTYGDKLNEIKDIYNKVKPYYEKTKYSTKITNADGKKEDLDNTSRYTKNINLDK
tara:strand:- start:1023 stop:1616 length:594 start_codon:yes stop_codon:yes gene_type:complete